MREAKIIAPVEWRPNGATHNHTTDFGPIVETIAQTFGGVTVTAGEGVWRDNDGAYVAEPVKVLTFVCEWSDAEQKTGEDIDTVRDIDDIAIRFVGLALNQKAGYVVYPTGEVAILERGKDY